MARYSGKYRRKKRTMPLASWVLVLMAVLSLSTGAVVAYLAASTGAVTNSFNAAQSKDPIIAESMSPDKLTKSNVAVQPNNPGYAVYVRAAVLVNWKNGDGNVLAKAPVLGTDYSMDPGDSGWFEHGGFYYYAEMVKDEIDVNPDKTDQTANLIDSITVLKPAPVSGYTLNVEIITQTIQALGTTDVGDIAAVKNAWGINVGADKKLIDPDPTP